jgi:hypothetical protein
MAIVDALFMSKQVAKDVFQMAVYSEILEFIENSKTGTCIYHKMKHYLAGQYQLLMMQDIR